MANAAQLDRQIRIHQRLAAVQTTQGDFSRSDQRDIHALDAVNLSLGATRHKADAFQNRIPSQIRRDRWNKPTSCQLSDRVLL